MEGVGDLTDLKKDSTVKAVPEKRFDSVLKEAVREADQAIKDTQIMDYEACVRTGRQPAYRADTGGKDSSSSGIHYTDYYKGSECL